MSQKGSRTIFRLPAAQCLLVARVHVVKTPTYVGKGKGKADGHDIRAQPMHSNSPELPLPPLPQTLPSTIPFPPFSHSKI